MFCHLSNGTLTLRPLFDKLRRLQDFEHPAAGEGVWGAQEEVPSFLYGMPLQPGRVFLEETCLVTKPALPFAVLKRRLERRLKAMGIKVCCHLLCLSH